MVLKDETFLGYICVLSKLALHRRPLNAGFQLCTSTDPDTIAAYVIIAKNEVKLDNNTVSTGGVGVWRDDKEVILNNGTVKRFSIFAFVLRTFVSTRYYCANF